jgi:FtsH-binding integral membrane protein
VAIGGLWAYRRRTPTSEFPPVTDAERRRVAMGFAWILGLGLAASFVSAQPALMLPIVVNFAIWTPLGFVLTSAALIGALGRG